MNTVLQDILGLLKRKQTKSPKNDDYIILAAFDNPQEALKPNPRMQPFIMSLKTLKTWIASSTSLTWGSITGTLSLQTDLQSALDSKVDENAAITGATKTKITYDAKGLVTAGADATTADIAASTNKNYVTDAQLTVIGNTSGTNSGNQTLANTSDATSHTATLSATGGSVKLVEGSGITLTTTGTSADGIITIASSSVGGIAIGDAVSGAASGDMLFVDSAIQLAKNSLLQFDTANTRMSIGVAVGGAAKLNIKGSGATSATFSQIITNSSNVLQFSVRDDGTAFVGPNGALSFSVRFQVKDQADNVCLAVSQSDCVFGDSAVLRSMNGLLQPTGSITFRNGNPNSATIDFGGSEVNTAPYSGEFNFIRFTRNWTAFAVSTNPEVNILKSENVINLTTGTGTKIVRGFYHNPTVTGVTSHRAFESSSGGGHFNTTSVNASAVLQADSTTQGFLMPRMTTAQRNAIATPAIGLSIYNTTTKTTDIYDGAAWQRFGQQTLIKGSGTTTATFSQINTDSAGNDTLQIRDDGAVKFGGGSFGHPAGTRFQVNNGSTGVLRLDTNTIFVPNTITTLNNSVLTIEGNATGVAIQPVNANIGWVTIGNTTVNTIAITAGTRKHVEVNQGYIAVLPATNVTVNQIEINPAINMNLQTGTKIFRGIYHNPTLTGTIDHRAFESVTGGGYFNTSAVNASAVLQADSTTQGFLMPRMTTTQRNAIVSPATGLEIYNTTTNSNNFYNGTAWEDTKLVTTNRQAASYTLVLGDANKLVEMNVGSANNLTVPLDSTVAYSVGTQILISQYGAGQTTVVATGGVTIRSNGGKLKLSGQYSGATLIKIATNEWYLFGDIAV
jgi:hypothetical protein